LKHLHRYLVAVAVLLFLALTTASAAAKPAPPVDLQILSVSDWHAQLDPNVVGTSQVGGAAFLSAYFQADRAANPNTLTLTAGDAFGGSPPLSTKSLL
jgi:5'-nucleotidase